MIQEAPSFGVVFYPVVRLYLHLYYKERSLMSIIQVRMKPNTIDQIDKLQERVHAPSRSDAIRRAIEISDMLVNAVEHGDKVIIESRNGKQRQILISGLNK